ncbi:condensation domain-containing protein [Micromonospora mangrovi]|uniref:Condensation domain-containing protein n=2 Tax=Micromonospora TaxID=1873 RepID=A0AAU7M9Y8_9ACTN
MTAAPQAPADVPVRAPLSLPQAFLVAFDSGDEGGPFGNRYFNTQVLRLTGALDVEALQQALDDLVQRHEALRTVVVRGGAEPYQEVRPAPPVRLVTSTLGDVPADDRHRRAEEFAVEVEAGTLEVDDLPLLRAHLGRFDETDAVLVLIAHHVATDGWSLRVLARDLSLLYARRTGEAVELPGAPSYRDFTVHQLGQTAGERVERSRAYWARKLDGARMLAVPMDRPRSAGGAKVTSTYRYVLDPDLARAVGRFAAKERSSTFIVLMAAYAALLRQRTGNPDVVTPTITAGRNEPEFENTVGAFFNFIPLRIDLSDCLTWRDVVARTRATCLEAQNHEIPFAEIVPLAPELMSTFAADDLAVGAMQVFQNPFQRTGRFGSAVSYTEMRERQVFQEVSSHIPDGVLWTLEVAPAGMVGQLKFNRSQFDTDTIAGLVEELQATLRAIVTTPDAPLPGV